MQYLRERELGYDKDRLGFPSISGCRAIVLQTQSGLYGFHNFGNSQTKSWSPAAKEFSRFVADHKGLGAGVGLYVVTKVDSGGGYVAPTGSKNSNHDLWVGEATRFAKELWFPKGPIFGVNLPDTVGDGSAEPRTSFYVEFRRVFTECQVLVGTWDDSMQNLQAGNFNSDDHKIGFGKKPYTRGYSEVAVGDLKPVTPEMLRF